MKCPCENCLKFAICFAADRNMCDNMMQYFRPFRITNYAKAASLIRRPSFLHKHFIKKAKMNYKSFVKLRRFFIYNFITSNIDYRTIIEIPSYLLMELLTCYFNIYRLIKQIVKDLLCDAHVKNV